MQDTIATYIEGQQVVSDTVRILLIPSSQSQDITDWLPLVIALLAVFMGPMIQLYLGKRQIKANVIASNRQQWINNLRDLIAEFNSTITILVYLLRKKKQGRGKWPEKLERAVFIESKIQTLLNPDKPLQKDLLVRVNNVSDKISITSDYDEIMPLLGEMNLAAQKLFTDTWLKVKRVE